ncbi:MAG TPA: hypothetical protein VHD86_23450 [Xanthobacteraceae bacterium]|nr:hypothetical protein [Xanthobacteraceae bacterium]
MSNVIPKRLLGVINYRLYCTGKMSTGKIIANGIGSAPQQVMSWHVLPPRRACQAADFAMNTGGGAAEFS